MGRPVKEECEYRRSLEDPGVTKYCSTCHEVKIVAGFNKLSRTKDGLNYTCRACQSGSNAAWRTANGDQHRENARVWGAKNRDLVARRNQIRRAVDPLYSRIVNGAAVARNRGCVVEKFTTSDLLAYWESNGISADRCFYTGVKLESNYHIDHKTPLSRGGAHAVHNIVPCSAEANQSKQTRTAEEFLATT
jgi:hypothetical protein